MYDKTTNRHYTPVAASCFNILIFFVFSPSAIRFSANRRSSNHLIDAPNGRIDQMTPWHFFRFLAARYALPPKIEKNALKKLLD